jgi:trimeric autotransporter adhesin
LDYNKNDSETGFTLGTNGPKAYVTFPGPTRPFECDLVVVRDEKEHVTIYETAIPWNQIGVNSPQKGKIMAVNFIINENDGKGRSYWMGMTPGIAETKKPPAYRKFVLVTPEKP